MKKLLLFAAAALTSMSLCANTVLPQLTEIKAAETTFEKSKAPISKPGAQLLPGAQTAKSFTLDNNVKTRILAPSRADKATVMPFSYCDEPYTLETISSIGSKENPVAIKAGTRVYLGFAMLTDDVKALAGNKVTEVTFFTPISNEIDTNPITNADFFIAPNFNSAYLYRQSINLGQEPATKVTVPLTTPYVIPDDQPVLVFGYSFIIPEGNENYWIPVDYVLPAPSQVSGLISATNDPALITNIGAKSPADWSSFSKTYGSLCMYLTIEGDNLPQDNLYPLTFESGTYIKPGEEDTLFILYKNKGANDIEKVGISASINGGETAKYEGTLLDYNTFLPSATKPGSRGLAAFRIPIPEEVEGTAKITFIIDQVNEKVENLIQGSYEILSYKNGYERKVVFEDATGNWCGWCPAGIAMLDYIKEKYPQALLIGVHASGVEPDPMAVTSYANAVNTLTQGYFPTVLVNRLRTYSPGGKSEETLKIDADGFMKELTEYPSYGNIEFTSTKRNSSSLNVSAKINFSVNLNQPHSVSFVTIQDEVGPYKQNNYYAKENAAPLGAWNTAGSSVNMIFNDVARGFKKGNAFTTTVEKDKEYTYESTVSYSKVEDGKPCRVAALLINETTGEIVNAAVMESLEGDSAGIEDVIAGENEADITIGAGSINVEGAETVAIYSLDGRKVADGSISGLATGIYIVVADGHSTKVAVY